MIVCGTGHRPNKLGGYSEQALNDLTNLAYEALVELKPEAVIAGGAIGWDQALANAAYRLKIPLTLAYPFEGFESKWPKDSVGARFHKEMELIVEHLDVPIKKVYVSEPGYAAWKMQVRNKWMVDNATHVLALWDGSAGGTGNCVAYANKIDRPVINLWERYA